ncbi:wax ester/triacylglycerol synthase family O-acyltransferase [Streptomyces roseofulvus]|uniref:Wax ester/triacylglycerol synthase family O-acyltransferase n=2 Tax=Streptomyces TaxID=1883 RepID=A0ABU4KHX4_9ACTN|nr:wax ester/triacylglycerol synthase domain-containing protein [Streptomyces roseolus]MDX2297344.1 wax ester/triacylglycerol synthase family O-acyltransferase [Streptomyces roseolus]
MRSSVSPRRADALPLALLDRLSLDTAALHPSDTALHLGGFVTLEGEPPPREQVARWLERRVADLPELAHRLGGSTRRPHWEPDPGFDPARHLYELPGSPDPAAAAAEVVRQPLPRDRPLWGLWLVRRVGAGYGLCYRAHHAFQDGAAAVATLEHLLGDEEGRPARTQAGLARRRPVRWRAVLPEFRPPGRTTWWSALDTPPSHRPAVALADTPLARLHALGRRLGATVPQLCLALTADTLRAWHPDDWAPGGPGHGRGLRAGMGIGVRDPREPFPLLGNRVAVAGLDLPCGEPDPERRLGALGRAVDYGRLAALADAQGAVLRRLPYRLGKLSLGRAVDARYTPVMVADLRIRRPLGFDGAPATAVYPLPVRVPGQPLFVAWATHRRRLHTTFVADAALAGADRLPEHWEAALTALERLAEEREPGAAEPTAPRHTR